MKHEPNLEIFQEAFSSRSEIAASLPNALLKAGDLDRLRKAHAAFKDTLDFLSTGEVEDKYRAFNTAVEIFLLLADWKHAIRKAEPEAQRFLSSAKLVSSELDKTLSFATDEKLTAFLANVESVRDIGELDSIRDELIKWSLPLLLFAHIHTESSNKFPGSKQPAEMLQPTVAFVRFDIDGKPAKEWNYLKPNVSYDLSIEVRVSNWPANVREIKLIPITIDPRERDWLPSFKFQKPDSVGPHVFTGTKRAVIELAHSFGARPYEFHYAAEFDDIDSTNGVAIVGHRRLLIEGTDVSSHPISGFTHVDQHLLAIRDKLRAQPGLNSEDLANSMVILAGLGNIYGQANLDALFAANTLEKEFQQKTTEILRGRSDIGEELQNHPGAAGGITDLTFRNITIELKVENNKVIQPKDCSKYFAQTAAYALALGKRIGILCVLESTKKTNPIGLVEEDIQVMKHVVGASQISIVVVLIRGGSPKPSSYSR